MIKQLPRILVVVCIAALALLPWLSVGADSSGDWTQYLGSSARTGFNAAETLITPANASQLQLQWNAKAGSLISAQPVASQGQIFWGSWDGYERSTNLDGTLNWQTYLGQSSDVCDTPRYGVTDSPVVSTISVNGTPTRVLIVGGGDDNEYALNAATGTVIWKTALSPNAGSFTWSSPTLYNGSVYVGVSSINDCPQVAGRLVKLDATTGAIQTVFNTVPQPPNVCKGGSIWTSPTIDTNTGIVYLAVGDTADCNDSSGNHINEPLSQALVEVQASDLSLVNHWQVPYSSTIGDGDMTTTPTLFTATLNGVTKQMVGLFNKNGSYYAFDTTSDIHSVGPVWTSQIAQTGQPDDGVSSVSSSAWDGQKLYLAGGATTIGGASCTGSIRAVAPSTGAFLWQDCLNTGEASAPVYGAVMASPGIVVVADGDMLRVVRTSDGTQLFSYTDTSADFNGPATISNGVIYIGDEAGNLLAFAPSTTTPTVTPTSTPTSTNLVQNGSFDSGALRPWSLVLHTGGNGSAALDGSTFVSSSDSAAITVTQANAVPWYVQLAQGQIPLTGNQQYTLSFSAKASVNRNVNVVLQQDHSPWSEYFSHDFAVTQSWQRYTLTFTPQTSDISAMLDFNLAQTTGQVWLDNVDVEGPPGAPTPTPTSSPTPTPTSSPTPTPTSSPTPTPTSSPTPNPTSSPTPNPTSSPTPTATPTSTVSPTATVSPTPTGTPSNLLTNGSFDGSSLSPWGVTRHTGASGSAAQDSSAFVSSPDSAKVSITQANSVPWYLQFGQGGVPLTAGTPYTVSFSAKASQQRNLNVVVQQNHTPWTEFTNHNVALTLAWQQYSFVFTPSSAESNAILQFNVAGATGQVWLDNVSVSSGSGSASLPARIAGSPGRIERNKLPRFPT